MTASVAASAAATVLVYWLWRWVTSEVVAVHFNAPARITRLIPRKIMTITKA